METQVIENGKTIAIQALQWCIFNNDATKAGAARAAIMTLFGKEVDAAIVLEFQKSL
jgi:hypothetical protein